MIWVLCGTCDQFIYAHIVDQHVQDEHPDQQVIRLRTWPDGEPVVCLDNEFDLFFSNE